MILVPDEWDAMALEASGISNFGTGVMPIDGVLTESLSDPRILPILSEMNEIGIWPDDLIERKPMLFDFLRDLDLPDNKLIGHRMDRSPKK